MDNGTLVDEVDEMIAHLEAITAAHPRPAAIPRSPGDASREILRARKARLYWLRQVRDGLLAERPPAALLH